MPATPAQIAANQKNAALSTGPKTPEGKERSRANALKHGLTGSGVVLPEREAAEVKARSEEFVAELKPTGAIGLALARRAAMLSVRMEAAAEQQTAAATIRVREALAEFEAPEGSTEAEAAKLRSEVEKRAMFDPSREASLARQYESAAERGFFRCLKELRQLRENEGFEAPAQSSASFKEELGSFFDLKAQDAEFDALYAELNLPEPPRLRNPMGSAGFRGRVDVPIAVGRPG